MKSVTLEMLKWEVYILALERGYIPAGTGQRRFFNHVTDYVKLPEFCRLVTAALRKKGVNMERVRTNLMIAQSESGSAFLEK